jgi:hypothetical protein
MKNIPLDFCCWLADNPEDWLDEQDYQELVDQAHEDAILEKAKHGQK